jgi:hypothetical protein
MPPVVLLFLLFIVLLAIASAMESTTEEVNKEEEKDEKGEQPNVYCPTVSIITEEEPSGKKERTQEEEFAHELEQDARMRRSARLWGREYKGLLD